MVPTSVFAEGGSKSLHSYSGSPREMLLEAISAQASDEEVLQIIKSLTILDPAQGRGASSDALGGSWKLLWSAGADKFSPLLSLPRSIRPLSLQLLGAAATAQVGEGRVANLLCFPFGVSMLLSSGVRPAADSRSCLEILPPFKLELLFGKQKVTLVEAGSDREFRAINARNKYAQGAPRNLYEQQYLDQAGLPGDLRVSTVVAGDPVIVGSVFVHQRI